MEADEEVILASLIPTDRFFSWPDHLRQDVYAWLTLNDIDYCDIPLWASIEVVLMDLPFIRWRVYHKVDGKIEVTRCGNTHTWNEPETQYDCTCRAVTKKMMKPLLFPMPDHLNALSSGNAILNWREDPE